MANTRGVFRLTYIIEEKISINSWISLSDVWVAPSPSENPVRFIDGVAATPNTGYFGGGTTTTRMDKVTYSSDTTAAVPGAFLSAARGYLAATGNSTAGYFGGGACVRSTMDKVTYASDTTAAVPGAFLSASRRRLAATGNSDAGYFGGGNPGPVTTMDKVTYSSDTTAAVPGAALSGARSYLAASSARANALPTSMTSPVPVIV